MLKFCNLFSIQVRHLNQLLHNLESVLRRTMDTPPKLPQVDRKYFRVSLGYPRYLSKDTQVTLGYPRYP